MMETTNLKIVYNHKEGYTAPTVKNKSGIMEYINRFARNYRQWITNLDKQLEMWGRAAGTAIRN